MIYNNTYKSIWKNIQEKGSKKKKNYKPKQIYKTFKNKTSGIFK